MKCCWCGAEGTYPLINSNDEDLLCGACAMILARAFIENLDVFIHPVYWERAKSRIEKREREREDREKERKKERKNIEEKKYYFNTLSNTVILNSQAGASYD
jgi:guanylate kinase